MRCDGDTHQEDDCDLFRVVDTGIGQAGDFLAWARDLRLDGEVFRRFCLLEVEGADRRGIAALAAVLGTENRGGPATPTLSAVRGLSRDGYVDVGADYGLLCL